MFSKGEPEFGPIIDSLSKTLKFGEQLRNDRLRSEESKRRALNEVQSRVKESATKQRMLREEISKLNSEISGSKIRTQKHQYDLEQSLTTLANLIKSLDKSNANAQRLKQVEELQTFYL